MFPPLYIQTGNEMAERNAVFQFDDHFLDEIPPLGPFTVHRNEASVVLPFRVLRDALRTGQSVRLPAFFVNQDDQCLAQWRFELRLYPSGQSHSANQFNVYLVLIECPSDHHPQTELEVLLTITVPSHQLVLQDKKTKQFNWAKKSERWLRLSVPTDEIRFRARVLFSVMIVSHHRCSMVPAPMSRVMSLKKRLQRVFSMKKNRTADDEANNN